MAKGFSLHIGLNAVDPNHYAGWPGPLNACEADALDMKSIAESKKMESKLLLTESATRENVSASLEDLADKATPNDFIFISYSGHGGQVPDVSGEEDDFRDETWCLYNGQMLDDEIYDLLSRIKTKTRVLVLSDSCHSGTITKAAYFSNILNTTLVSNVVSPGFNSALGTEIYRAMPDDVALKTYRQNRKFYDQISRDPDLENAKEKVSASILLISGCQDNQLSVDGTFNGVFTSNVLRVWANGNFKGNYEAYHRDIVLNMKPTQSPNFYFIGTPYPEYLKQTPFEVNVPVSLQADKVLSPSR